MRYLTKVQVIERLKKSQGARTQSEFADELNIGQSYLSEVMSGRRDPGDAILNHLGLQKAVLYKAVK